MAGGPKNTPSEASVVKRIRDLLKSRGAWAVKPLAGPKAPRGTPDLLCCYAGLFLGIEVKAPGGKHPVTPHQNLAMRAIRAAGGLAFVAHGPGTVKAVLDAIDNGWTITVDDSHVPHVQPPLEGVTA